MKTRIIKSILALLLIFTAMPMMGQDYLTIKLKDGKEERHLLALVNGISTSMYDADGVMYSDYAFQLISMRDTVYYYAIEDIESISFKSVSEDQLNENTASALSSVVSVLEDCDSFDDIKNYSREIANAEGVEKVDVYDKAIVVRIKDWRDIVIHDIPEKGDVPSNWSAKQHMPHYAMPKTSKSPHINKSVRVAIVDQNAKNEDPGYVYSTNVLLKIKDSFSQMGYDVKYIPQPSLDFFREDIFKNEIIMLTTHGFYIDGKHWFATGEEIGEATQSWLNSRLDSENFWGDSFYEVRYSYIKNNLDIDYVRLMFVQETRGGKKKWILYTICSEDYIGNSPYKFEKGDALIFTNVCESLDGNHSVAEMFHRKGASTYIGYEGTTVNGERAGAQFLCDYLLSGTSKEYASQHFAPSYLIETDHEGAVLNYLNYENASQFITKTVTCPSSQVKDELQNDGRHLLTFYGYTTILNKDAVSNNIVGLAFQVSQNENMENAQTVLCNANFSETDSQNGNIKFWGSVEAEPGNTYYYRAYTYDDINPNYGETCSFTIGATKKLIKVEPTEIDFGQVEVGSSKSATFTVSNVGTASLTFTVASSLDDGDCILAGSGQQFTLAAGQSKTFTVTYSPTSENSGFNAIVRILSDAEDDTQIVTISGRSYKAADIPSYTSCPDDNHPHLIDLGIRGVLWSCCNVGASKPEEYGSYYAWGETEEKAVYSWNTYIHCEGNYDSCHDIGSEIAGTDYDVAHVKWGEPWIMPNHMDFESLIVLCKHEYITVNGVSGCKFTGTNGGSIFFPAAGYRQGSSLNEDYYNKPWGEYWSSTLKGPNRLAYDFYFCFNGWCSSGEGSRSTGFPVRPIVKK
jgi:hypothetical protein